MLRALKHWLWPFHWRTVRRSGAYAYRVCSCGGRKAIRVSHGGIPGPPDAKWLRTGEWTELGDLTLPSTPSSPQRRARVVVGGPRPEGPSTPEPGSFQPSTFKDSGI